MAAMCFEDDFHNRVRKQIQSQFRKSVIPSHLLPHLQCLAIEDEERVQAVEKNSGPTLAADELFNLIIRRTNWIEDLTRALRDPDVKLEFLADEIEKLLKEVPMRWDINGFVDNFGRACFDGNCGTVEPMQHDEGETYSQPVSFASALETPGQEQCMELLKQQSTLGELKPEQYMKELKETDETECKVKTDNHDTSIASVPTVHEDNTQSIEERRADLKLKIIEKIWSFVREADEVPVALAHIDRALLQFAGTEKGSLLFKVNVSTLDDLQRVQELVRYGGMKKILDKELVEKHMEIFKDLAREERLELLSVNSKLYIHQSDLERCKALLSFSKDEVLGLEGIDNLPTENFQKESDILLMKQLKEILPPICVKMLKDPFLLNRLPRFFKLHAQAVKNASKRESQIEPQTKHDVEDILDHIDELGEREPRVHSEIFKNLNGCLDHIKDRREGSEDLHILFVKWVEREFASFFDSLSQGNLTLVIQGAAELMCKYMDPIPVHIQSLRRKEREVGGLFDKFPNLSIDFKTALTPEAYSRLEALGIIKRYSDKFEFISDLLRGIMFAYLMDTSNIIGDDSLDEDIQSLEKAMKHEVGVSLSSATIIATPLYTPNTEGKIDEDGSLDKPVKYEDLHLSHIQKRRRERLDNLKSLTSYKFASYLLQHTQGNEDNAIPSDIWLTDNRFTTAEFLRRGIVSLRCLLFVKKNIISIGVQSLEEICDLMYLPRGKYFYTLLLQENVISRNRLEIEVCVQLPGFSVLTRSSQGLDELTEFFGVSKLATRLKMNATGIFASDLMGHLETGNFANITHFSLFDTEINGTVSSPLGLRYMPRLQTIDLHGCDFGDAGISFLGKELGLLKELKEINVAKNGMSSEGLQDLSNGLCENHGIRALRLQNNTLGIDGGVVLAGWLKRLYLLETLNISGCGIGDFGAKYISKSFVSKVLRQLSMRENEITKEGSVIFFENMRSMKMVEHLDFGRNKVFDDWDITALEEPVRLDIGDGPEVHLSAFLQEQTHWSHLNLWACNLGAFRIFRSPEKFHAMKDLVNLCLQSNQIDDPFAGDVGACLKMYCNYIRYVNLKHNRIGNDGAIAIADGIADKKYIQELQIDRNQIEKEGVSRLLKTTLRFAHPMTLDVSCNSLAKFDIDNLQHELSLKVSTSEQDSGVEGTTRIYVPRDNEHKVKIYM